MGYPCLNTGFSFLCRVLKGKIDICLNYTLIFHFSSVHLIAGFSSKWAEGASNIADFPEWKVAEHHNAAVLSDPAAQGSVQHPQTQTRYWANIRYVSSVVFAMF